MSKNWDYAADLPGGMTHSVQVQTDSSDVDFNLYVLDSAGNVLAKDDGPEAGAECSFQTSSDESCIIRVELAEGNGGFSLNVASQTTPPSGGAPAPMEPNDPSATNTAGGDESAPTNGSTRLTQSQIDELLAAHNQWRSKFGVGPLQWSDELAAFAQAWADKLADEGMQMKHRSPNQYGENLYWAAGKRSSAQEVVDAWGSEEQFYDYEQNNWWPKAGHFSQVIWNSTTHVGGGIVEQNGQEIWVCNYNPRGNWTGEKPY